MQLSKRMIRPIATQLASAAAATLHLDEHQVRTTWNPGSMARDVREVLPVMQVSYVTKARKGGGRCR